MIKKIILVLIILLCASCSSVDMRDRNIVYAATRMDEF